VSAGENISAALVTMAIQELGCAAVSLTGWQAGLVTDSMYGNARIRLLQGSRIRRELDLGKIVVVAGFQGIDRLGNVTTLGRGGSDTTAVALAALLEADRCVIFTDVDGVYDKDPRIFPDARKYAAISYGDMLALCADGAQVLHDRSVELARDQGICLEVCSAFSDAPGTLVGPS
jgi:aspartate kinase